MGIAQKQRVRELIDDLPEEELPAAQRYLEFLREKGGDPCARLDQTDELSDVDRENLHESLRRGLAQSLKGRGQPMEEFLAEFKEP